MANCFDYSTTYFWREGKSNLHDCLRISFEAAKRHGIGKIVIFTGVGEGVRAAVHDFLSQEDYADIRIVAVTFPHGHKHDIPDPDREWIASNNISLVRAHLPFDPIKAQYQGHGVFDLGPCCAHVSFAYRLYRPRDFLQICTYGH